MKNIFLAVILSITATIGFSQSPKKKQTLILLDNEKGVPFYKDKDLNDFVIDGFEIDNRGNFYFLSGDKLVRLAAFSGSKLIYSKTYKDLGVGTSQLYFYKNDLYTFDRLPPNKLIVFNPINGQIKMKYENVVLKNSNSYLFADSSLIVGFYNNSKNIYEQYSLTDRHVKQVLNKYNLPSFFNQDEAEFLGKWGDKFVFWEISGKNLDMQKFWTVNKDGKVVDVKNLPNDNKIFGENYAENPPEDRKVRNGMLYVLGRRANQALVTEIPLQDLFIK